MSHLSFSKLNISTQRVSSHFIVQEKACSIGLAQLQTIPLSPIDVHEQVEKWTYIFLVLPQHFFSN